LGGVAGLPLAARAQQPERMGRIGVLMSGDENDPVYKTRLSAFTQALAGLGWTDGRLIALSRDCSSSAPAIRASVSKHGDSRPAISAASGSRAMEPYRFIVAGHYQPETIIARDTCDEIQDV